MQSMALRLARETWLTLNRHIEAKVLSRSAPRSAPPKTRVNPPQFDQDMTAKKYCMYCGTQVDKAGAKFCESCGKSLWI